MAILTLAIIDDWCGSDCNSHNVLNTRSCSNADSVSGHNSGWHYFGCGSGNYPGRGNGTCGRDSFCSFIRLYLRSFDEYTKIN